MIMNERRCYMKVLTVKRIENHEEQPLLPSLNMFTQVNAIHLYIIQWYPTLIATTNTKWKFKLNRKKVIKVRF
jgi:hypothetical protein